MSNGKVALFVGAHCDDIELSCGGTVQTLAQDGYLCVGLPLSKGRNEEEAERRLSATIKSSRLLGYTLILPELYEEDLQDIPKIKEFIDRAIEGYNPYVIFGPSPEDQHYHHKTLSVATDYAGRGIRNRLHFAGPLSEREFNPPVYMAFTRSELDKKIRALRYHKRAYGSARYFTRESIEGQASWLGQKAFEYYQREEAPFIVLPDGRRVIPYAEWFEIPSMVNPLLSDEHNLFYQVASISRAMTIPTKL